MEQAVFIAARDLPPSPIDAAKQFLAQYGAGVRTAVQQGDDVVIGFADASPDHAAWRLAMVQELAREASPCRVNAVIGADGDAITRTLAFLADAPGVTGQVLELTGNLPQSA